MALHEAGPQDTAQLVDATGGMRPKGLERLKARGFSDAQIEAWRKRHMKKRSDETAKDGLTDEERRLQLGEKLFSLLESKAPEYAQVVTGMILDKGNEAVAYLLRRPEALEIEVRETAARVDACLLMENDEALSAQSSTVYGVTV